MVHHNQETHHPLSLSFADLSVWCYSCDDYIHNEVSRGRGGEGRKGGGRGGEGEGREGRGGEGEEDGRGREMGGGEGNVRGGKGDGRGGKGEEMVRWDCIAS